VLFEGFLGGRASFVRIHVQEMNSINRESAAKPYFDIRYFLFDILRFFLIPSSVSQYQGGFK